MKLNAPIAVGNTANIYLWNNKIIKVFNDYLPGTEANYEASKQKIVYSLGVSVPEVIAVTEIDGKQAIIMEYIKGKTFGSIVMENLDKAEFYMELSTDIQREVHGVVADELEPMSLRLKRQIEQAAVLERKYKEILLQKLDSFSYEVWLCHGDFHLFNLIDSEKKVTIIDWVDSSSGDFRADVCRTYLLYSEISMDLAEMYLRMYCDKSNLSKDEVLQWLPIIAGARLSENISADKSAYLLDIVYRFGLL